MFRSRSKRIAQASAALAVGVFGVFATTACGSTAAPDSGSATEGTITWWGWSPEINVAEQYIDAFNKEYPDITVNYKQIPIADYDAALRPALASSAGPDVFDVAPGGGIGSISLYGQSAVDLTPIIEDALGSDWQSQIAPIGVSGMTTDDGKFAGLPIGSTFAGTLWINQDLFDQFGVEPPTNLDEWTSVCDTFRAGGVGCFLQGAAQVAFNQDTLQSIADSVEPGWWTKASSGEADWNDPVMVEALSIWKSLFTDGIMDEGALGLQQYPDANNAFFAQKTASVMMGTWYMQNSTVGGATASISAAGVGDPVPFTAVAVPFPDVAGKGNPSSLYGDADYGLAINSKSKVQAAAATFVTWLTTSEEGQQVIANALVDIPSLNGVTPDWGSIELVNPDVQRPALEELMERTTTVEAPRLSLISSDLQQAIGVASTTVAEGQATPEQAAQTLSETVSNFK